MRQDPATSSAQEDALEEQLRAAVAPPMTLTPAQRADITAWAAEDYVAGNGAFLAGFAARTEQCTCCGLAITGDAYKIRSFWFRAECLSRALNKSRAA